MKTKHCPDCGKRMTKVGNAVKWWSCTVCGATAPLSHAPGTPPDLTAIIGPERRTWLGKQPGGVSAALRRLIDEAMKGEAK